MAMANLSIKDQGAAENWKSRVSQLNQQTNTLLVDVGKALVAVQEGADSTIVDDIAQYGNQILEGAGNILEGMNQLVSVVTNVISMINQVLDSGKGIVKNIINAIGSI